MSELCTGLSVSGSGGAFHWASGARCESYVGRWSRLVAREFVTWLQVSPVAAWLDVGCGTGALTQAVLDKASPRSVDGVDASVGYVSFARGRVSDPRARFVVGNALALPCAEAWFDAVVSGLVLNFLPDAAAGLREVQRVAKPSAVIGTYVWDYAGEMQLMRYFWDAAVALDPRARDLDEGRRFPMCNAAALRDLFEHSGLREVDVRAIDVPTDFNGFDDYWSPFLSGEAPAPGYAMSLSEERRAALRDRIRSMLPTAPDGSIHLIARAWAARAQR